MYANVMQRVPGAIFACTFMKRLLASAATTSQTLMEFISYH